LRKLEYILKIYDEYAYKYNAPTLLDEVISV